MYSTYTRVRVYIDSKMYIVSVVPFLSVGHSVLGVNGIPAEGRYLQDGREILEVLSLPENYPINIKFGRQKLSTNEKIMLASMFHS